MHERIKFWWQALRHGAGGLDGAAGWVGLIALVLGVAAGVTVPLVVHVSHWLTAVVLLSLFALVVLEGSYRVWTATDSERKIAQAEAQAKPSTPEHSPRFWDVTGSTLAGNEITNTYNASAATDHESGTRDYTLVTVEPNAMINKGVFDVEYGDQIPQLPDVHPSTQEERTSLRIQLLALAYKIELVMTPYGQMREVVAAQIGVPPEEFSARMQEILAARERMDDEATDRYNRECRSAVLEAYGHARSIGFVDEEMERFWRTDMGAGASGMPTRLRRVAAQVV